MASYKETWDVIEASRDQEILKVIVDTVVKTFNIKDERVTDARGLFQLILLGEDYDSLRDVMFYLLKQYGVSKKSLLYEVLCAINNLCLSDEWSKEFISAFKRHPYVQKLRISGNIMDASTDLGHLKVVNLSRCREFAKIASEDNQMLLVENCHSVCTSYAPYFRQDYIVTSLMPNLFGGKHLHSYFELVDDGTKKRKGILDISHGMFFEGTCFQEVFKPEEVSKFPAKELNKRYRKLRKEDKEVPNDCAKVLALALSNIRKRD